MLNFSWLFGNNSSSRNNISRFKKHLSSSEQAVINAIEDGVVVVGNDANILLVNPSAEKILSWTSNDACGLNYASILKITDENGKENTSATNPIAKALLNSTPFSSREVYLKPQNSKTMPVSLNINPINEENAGIVVVFRNISKEIKENREQAEFISTASHEMRTPVASIEGYLGLALNPNTATIDERAKDYITKAHESTQHLGRLFQDLLDVTKADDGKLKSESQVINTSGFIKSIWEGHKIQAEKKGLRYIYEPNISKSGEKQLTPVFFTHADKDHLREVVDNLIENAVKYTPSGEVSVNVSGDNDAVEITVRDSGIGIPVEDIPHLFQKFYRVDNSDTREIGGTGLGLYLSRRLVESMSGKIAVESEYKKGSVFKITLPRISSEEARRLQEIQDKKGWSIGEIPIDEVKLTSQAFTPNTRDKNIPKPEYFSAEDVAAMIRQQMNKPDDSSAQAVTRSTTSETEVISETSPSQTIENNSEKPQPKDTLSAAPDMPTPAQPAAQPSARNNLERTQLAPMPPQPRPAQVQNLAPRPREVQPNGPPPRLMLSDIEKTKEDYVRQMAANRQNGI
ncbi:PAS domain-containing protein [Candidatus Saccharibacteria bacterium]|nr:PAS domain-containing protein [Candidatus Saccharibacteria bacterium]